MVFLMFGARPASVLWRPPEHYFFGAASVGADGPPTFVNSAAHIGRAKLKAKLRSPNLDDWRIPPKPPKMRWATYDRLIEQYLKYDAVLGGVPIQA